MAMQTATYWAMTINNPDDNDRALVTNGYEQHVRSLIYTEEVGENGTPHIQAWIKLQRQQRMSFVKKLFPRAHLTPLTKDEHELNTRRYVQKNDETTDGAHIQTFNDPVPDCVSILKRFCTRVLEENREIFDTGKMTGSSITSQIKYLEGEAVIENPYNAKIFVSPTYTKIKTKYLEHIFQHIVNKLDADGTEDDEEDEPATGEGLPAVSDAQSEDDADWQDEDEEGSCFSGSESSDSASDEEAY